MNRIANMLLVLAALVAICDAGGVSGPMRRTVVAAVAAVQDTTNCFVYSNNATADGTAGGWTANKALDGSTNNNFQWGNNSAFPHWWQYDFGATPPIDSQKVTQIDIKPYNDGNHTALKNFSVSGSVDGVTWVACATNFLYNEDKTTAAPGTCSWLPYTLSPPDYYRFYRIVATDNYRADAWTIIMEIKAYRTP